MGGTGVAWHTCKHSVMLQRSRLSSPHVAVWQVWVGSWAPLITDSQQQQLGTSHYRRPAPSAAAPAPQHNVPAPPPHLQLSELLGSSGMEARHHLAEVLAAAALLVAALGGLRQAAEVGW